jgi:hypothetical protein
MSRRIEHMFDQADSSEVPSGPDAEGSSSSLDPRSAPKAFPSGDSATPQEIPAGTGVTALQSLVGLDLTGLSGRELLDVQLAWERNASWVAANIHRVVAASSARLMAEWSEGPDGGPDHQLMVAEVAAATRQSEMRVWDRWQIAHRLTGVLTATLTALDAGQISDYHALIISKETELLSPTAAVKVETAVLPKAGQRNRLRCAGCCERRCCEPIQVRRIVGSAGR